MSLWSLFRQEEGKHIQHKSRIESHKDSIAQFLVGEAVLEWILVDLQKNASPRFSTFLTFLNLVVFLYFTILGVLLQSLADVIVW